MNNILIALGGNLGDVEVTFSRACILLSSDLFDQHLSRIYTTDPVYDKPGAVVPVEPVPSYLNAVLRAKTYLSPNELLHRLLEVEQVLGRVRPAPECSPRTIDLDLLLYEDLILDPVDKCELILPHPRMHHRQFVLEPACDVAPDWIHPVLKRSLREILAALPK